MDIDDVNFETLEITREGHVLEVVLDRPDSDVNAINGTVHRELALLFETLKNETQARAIILTGRGRAFSAGGDFKWFPELQDTSRVVQNDARSQASRLERPTPERKDAFQQAATQYLKRYQTLGAAGFTPERPLLEGPRLSDLQLRSISATRHTGFLFFLGETCVIRNQARSQPQQLCLPTDSNECWCPDRFSLHDSVTAQHDTLPRLRGWLGRCGRFSRRVHDFTQSA